MSNETSAIRSGGVLSSYSLFARELQQRQRIPRRASVSREEPDLRTYRRPVDGLTDGLRIQQTLGPDVGPSRLTVQSVAEWLALVKP